MNREHQGDADEEVQFDRGTEPDFLDPPRDPEELDTEPQKRRLFRSMSRRTRVILLLITAIIVAGNSVRVPYYSLGPGPATDVLAALQIEDATRYPSEGELLLTTASISSRTLTIFEYMWTFIEPNEDAIHQRFILPPGRTDAEQAAENRRLMEASKVNAQRAAFQQLDIPVEQLEAARVLDLLEDAPARGQLEADDLIVAIDQEPTPDAAAVVEAVRQHQAGDVIAVTYRRDGAEAEAKIELGLSDQGAATMGVSVIDAFRFPIQVDIETRKIGGPSGGLVFALAIVDALTEEDLTRGHTIAVTGTIGFVEGKARVGAIGAIEEKVRGAAGAGADVFIVPAGDAARARAVAPEGMRIEPVDDLAGALAALRALEPA
ncbi:MAG: PDZ domain-containing protein [Actinomycetota bacterium]